MDRSTDQGTTDAGANAQSEQARFMRLEDVMAELNIGYPQAIALVRSGELPAIRVGGRGMWRVERARFEEFIARMYQETEAWVALHPRGGAQEDRPDPE